jgi:hypothetical protein
MCVAITHGPVSISCAIKSKPSVTASGALRFISAMVCRVVGPAVAADAVHGLHAHLRERERVLS